MAFCMYLRKSRVDYEAERVSHVDTLSRHHDILSDLAVRNRHVIGHVYREVVSGDTIQDRPQCQQMINDIIAGKWEGVYVTEIERLARGDTADQGIIQRVFMVSGALIVTPSQTYDSRNNATDEQSLEFRLFLARQELKTLNRRQQAGRSRSFEEGKFLGSRAPYGYRKYKLTDQRGYSLSIHEDESRVVRQIAQWYLYGMDGKPMGLTAIAHRLTEMGVSPGENARVWNATRLHRMLTNPEYAGYVRWGYDKLEKRLSLTGYEKKRVIHNDCEIRKGIHTAILSEDVFQAIQNKLHGYDKHLPVRKGAKLANPLAGLVYCAECGHILSHLPKCGRQPAILKCRTHGCPTVQTYREPVEQSILAVLRQWLDDAGRESEPETEKAPDPILSAIDTLTAERDKIKRQISRLQDLLEQEVYTVEQYNERFSHLSSRLDEVNASMDEELKKQASKPDYATPRELAPAIVRLLDAYPSATPQEQNDMLRACISSVVYRKEKPGLVLRGHTYSDPSDFSIDVYPLIKK